MSAQIHVLPQSAAKKPTRVIHFRPVEKPAKYPHELEFTGQGKDGLTIFGDVHLTKDWGVDCMRGKIFAMEFLSWVFNPEAKKVEDGILGVLALRMMQQQQKGEYMDPMVVGFFGEIGDLLRDGCLIHQGSYDD